MKKIIKLVICLLLIFQLASSTVIAQAYTKTLYFYDVTYKCFIGDNITDVLPNITSFSKDGKELDGSIKYIETSDLTVGYHEIKWIFTPNDSMENQIDGIVKVNILAYPILTEHDLIMYKDEIRDIDVDNKISKCKYKWSSSNPLVATVDKTGNVTSINSGMTVITCKITTSNAKVIVLQCNVQVK